MVSLHGPLGVVIISALCGLFCIAGSFRGVNQKGGLMGHESWLEEGKAEVTTAFPLCCSFVISLFSAEQEKQSQLK